MSEEHYQWKKLWACQEIPNNTFESPTTDFFKAQHCCVAFFGPAFHYLFPFSTNHHYFIFSQQFPDFAYTKTVRLFSWGSPLNNSRHPLYDLFFHSSLPFKCQRNFPQSGSNPAWQGCKNNCCDLFSTQVLCGLRNFSLCISCVDVWKGRACVGGPRTCLMVCWRVSGANFHVPEKMWLLWPGFWWLHFSTECKRALSFTSAVLFSGLVLGCASTPACFSCGTRGKKSD